LFGLRETRRPPPGPRGAESSVTRSPGLLVVLVCVILGEMAPATPTAGFSFSTSAHGPDRAVGPGFNRRLGLYWWFWYWHPVEAHGRPATILETRGAVRLPHGRGSLWW